MEKKIIIAAGGTGGHIYPAIALAEQLLEIIPQKNLLFVGGGLDDNRYFNRNSFAYQSVACGSFVKKRPMSLMKNMGGIGKGIWQSLRLIKQFKPDLAIGFGSYYSLPPLIASKMASVPFILHEANSIPGKVIRLLSRQALVTGVHFPQTQSFLKGKTLEVGMPLRKGYQQLNGLRHAAVEYFNLSGDLPTILIFGGSQGAQAINQLCLEAILRLKNNRPMQILHFTGNAAAAELHENLYRENGIRAVVKGFETRMDLAWSAADIVISRSGAGTIAELVEFEVPAILIPYPTAADNHQEFNADFLVDHVGGGIKLLEKNLDSIILSSAVESILLNKTQMQAAIDHYKKGRGPINLCELVKRVLTSNHWEV